MKKVENKSSFYDYADLEIRNRYKEFWLYTYTNRHVVRGLDCSPNPLKYLSIREETLRDLRYDFCPEISKRIKGSIQEKLADLEFESCLVYSFHDEYENNRFYDLRYQLLRAKFNNPHDKFSILEKELVKPWYRFAKTYGFTLTSLLLAPGYKEICELFIDKSSKVSIEKYLKVMCPFEKSGESFKGVQVLLAHEKTVIKIKWDCVIYYKVGSVFSRLNEELNAHWNEDGKVIIGDKADYDICVYVNRNDCTRRFVKQILSSQIFWLNFGQMGRVAINSKDKQEVVFPTTSIPSNTIEDFYSKLLPTVAFGTKLYEKKRSLEKDNIRRAIALMHWDKINAGKTKTKSEQALFKETIDWLRAKDVKILDCYQSEYSKPDGESTIKGDSAAVRDTVIREMKAEYDLCSACIDQHDYLTPAALKKKK